MSDQKVRWAARAARYEQMAAKARTEAARLMERRGAESDMAFLTQPGLLPARDRMRARLNRASELVKRAQAYEEKAENLRTLASRNKGDAERARAEARNAPIFVGDLTDSIWGRRRVVKVNTKSVRLEGVSCAVDRAHVRIVEVAHGVA